VTRRSLWLEEASEPIRSHPLTGKIDAEIVGGGVTGCAAALTLARAGWRVRLHDAREIAGGASGRNGGFALRGGAMPFHEAVRDHGAAPARLLWESSEGALVAIAELAGDAFRAVGSIRLAVDEAEAAELRREYDALVAAGFAAVWLDPLPHELARNFVAGLGHPSDGALQPARWVRRLAHLAAQEGVDVREHSRVVRLSELQAEHVVVATDGYPTELLASEARIAPTRGQVVATAPLGRVLFPVPCYARHGLDYWHQTPDRRLVYGGHRDASPATEQTAEEGLAEPVQRAIEAAIVELLGEAPTITHRWSGIFGSTTDLLPYVGAERDVDGVWVAGGYSGHGNVLGFVCGELVARAILGERSPLLDLFDPGRSRPGEGRG
jgi:gamma-glutamylputrescine oxidase